MRQQFSLTAIIYDKRGRVLSIGKNSYTKTHPMMHKIGVQTGNPHKNFLHAEVAAIVRCKDLSIAHSIKVFRVGKSGDFLNAKPCAICEEAIRQAGILNVYHT